MKTGKKHSRLQARMMTAVNTDYPTDDNPDNSSTADISLWRSFQTFGSHMVEPVPNLLASGK